MSNKLTLNSAEARSFVEANGADALRDVYRTVVPPGFADYSSVVYVPYEADDNLTSSSVVVKRYDNPKEAELQFAVGNALHRGLGTDGTVGAPELHDIFEVDGRTFVTMDYVGGLTVGEYIGGMERKDASKFMQFTKESVRIAARRVLGHSARFLVNDIGDRQSHGNIIVQDQPAGQKLVVLDQPGMHGLRDSVVPLLARRLRSHR
jgi:hypothetical protein